MLEDAGSHKSFYSGLVEEGFPYIMIPLRPQGSSKRDVLTELPRFCDSMLRICVSLKFRLCHASTTCAARMSRNEIKSCAWRLQTKLYFRINRSISNAHCLPRHLQKPLTIASQGAVLTTSPINAKET